MSRILVTGPTGNVGRATLDALLARGADVVAGARPGSTAELPAPTVPLDFEQADTWDAALDGVDRVFLLRPPPISDVGSTLNAFVDHGRDRLRHVVFLSVAGAEKNTFIPHAKVERHLREGDIPWTFLRAGFFGQNLTGPYRQDIRDDDRLYVPAGKGRAAWVDTRDLGEAAACAFADPEAARNTAWLLTGPETRSFAEVAAILTEVLGRRIRYDAASIPGYVHHLRSDHDLPWSPAIVYTVLHLAIRWGGEDRVDPTLERVLGRRPRTIRDTIEDHRHLWMPD